MDYCCSGVSLTSENVQTVCGGCGKIGRDVARQTVVHQVKSERLPSVGSEDYKFCSSPECPVVYYSPSGKRFAVDDVRELVTSKTEGDARPLCYCFGFTEGLARTEIAIKGESSIPAQVSQFIKERLCACEIRNPSGVCCLGEINRTLKRLSVQSIVEKEEL